MEGVSTNYNYKHSGTELDIEKCTDMFPIVYTIAESENKRPLLGIHQIATSLSELCHCLRYIDTLLLHLSFASYNAKNSSHNIYPVQNVNIIVIPYL